MLCKLSEVFCMIEMINVTKEYIKDNHKVIAIQDININFECGKMYAIMGPSGSGKTTILQLLGLLDIPSKGCIKIEQQNISSMKERAIDKFRSNEIGFIFQSFYLNENLNAVENVILPLLINNKIKKQNRKKLAILLLITLGMKNRLFHYPKELSGGEQQRVAIARAVANNPKIILADEPTASLDYENSNIILSFLKKMSRRNKCVIVTSHNDVIKKYADYVIFLEDGMIKEKEVIK